MFAVQLVFVLCRLNQSFTDAFSRDYQLIRADPKHGLSVIFQTFNSYYSLFCVGISLVL